MTQTEEIKLEVMKLLFEYGTVTRDLITGEISNTATGPDQKKIRQRLEKIRFLVMQQINKLEKILTNKEVANDSS